MPEISSHTRVNDILLGPIERPVLQWLARHMPAWVSPDKLTTFGVMGSGLIFFSYWGTQYSKHFLWLASLGFIINWFGDSLDGTLARYRNIQRPRYGFFVDHMTDALSMVLVFLGLGLSPFVRLDVACLALIGYLLMSILVYVRTCVVGEFKISYAKIGPTEMRVLAILANTLVYIAGNPQFKILFIELSVYDWIGLLVFLVLTGACLITTLRQVRLLANIDQKPIELRPPLPNRQDV